jgi:hypothetical protein
MSECTLQGTESSRWTDRIRPTSPRGLVCILSQLIDPCPEKGIRAMANSARQPITLVPQLELGPYYGLDPARRRDRHCALATVEWFRPFRESLFPRRGSGVL